MKKRIQKLSLNKKSIAKLSNMYEVKGGNTTACTDTNITCATCAGNTCEGNATCNYPCHTVSDQVTEACSIVTCEATYTCPPPTDDCGNNINTITCTVC